MIALLLATALEATPVPEPTLRGDDVVWTHRPSGMDAAAAWPGGAPSANARVVLQCTLHNGVPTACIVVSEDPPRTAARAASLKLVTHYKAAPTTKSGASTEGGTVRIPINWNFGG